MKLNFLSRYVKKLGITKTYYTRSYIREQYYERLGYPESLEDLVELFEKRNESLQSTAEIHFKNLPFGVSQKEIIAKLGKPHFIKNIKFLESNYTILFFKERIAGYSATIQTHLLNDMFFCGKYILGGGE